MKSHIKNTDIFKSLNEYLLAGESPLDCRTLSQPFLFLWSVDFFNLLRKKSEVKRRPPDRRL